jgi:flavin reductase (DIM6/NTAB) family NADH-FMN oxidoreductase RutF
MKPTLSPEEITLRKAFGSFPTGVTIVSGLTDELQPIGVTISSFNTVSIHPPLVLWSLVNSSKNLPYFQVGKKHLIHILADDQGDLALHFAKSDIDKFKNMPHSKSALKLPKLDGCVTYLECETQDCHLSGDHTIIVSQILGIETNNKNPLVYGRSKFIKPIF